MIRLALLLALTCTAFAADMVHQRVTLTGGEELVGWWCADQGVLYLDNGKRRLIDKPAEQVAKVEAAPTNEKAPARKQFKAPADLPYGRITPGDNPDMLGWWDAEARMYWTENGSGHSVGEGSAVFQPLESPGPMPDAAKGHVRRKAVEQD